MIMETHEETTRRLPLLRERRLPETCREAVNTILKEIYGYGHFRDLEIYNDLFRGKDKLCISQEQLIESVIREVEKAKSGEKYPDNVLLTAPNLAPENHCFSSCPPSIWDGSMDCLPLWFLR